MNEIHSFRVSIQNYITDYCLKHKGVKISYYFRDLNNGMWMGINEKELFTPASLMKVPTMIAILKQAQTNPEILKKKLEYNHAEFIGVDEEAGFPKKDHQSYSVDELILHSIAYSDNAATIMLMREAGMNNVIKVEDDLNLHVASGYSDQTNFVSVKVYADVLRILYNAAYLNEDMSQMALKYLTQSVFAEGIKAGIPAGIKVAHKYGARDIIFDNNTLLTYQLHEFGIVYYPGKPFLLGIMTRGENSKEEKMKLIRDLSSITYEEVNKEMLNSNSDNKGYLQKM